MPRGKRFAVTNLLSGGRHFLNLGRRTANLQPGEQDGRQHSAKFDAAAHRPTHVISSGLSLWELANDVPAISRKNSGTRCNVAISKSGFAAKDKAGLSDQRR